MNSEIVINWFKKDICQKYIFIKLGNGEEKIVSLSDHPSITPNHWEIGDEYASTHEMALVHVPQTELEFSILGGGKLEFYYESRKLRVYDSSEQFGREPRERTIRILQESFPDYEIDSS